MPETPIMIPVAIFAGALGLSAPLWTLVAFGAYLLGRGKRQFSIADLVILLTLEAIALAIAAAICPLIFAPRDG